MFDTGKKQEHVLGELRLMHKPSSSTTLSIQLMQPSARALQLSIQAAQRGEHQNWQLSTTLSSSKGYFLVEVGRTVSTTSDRLS